MTSMFGGDKGARQEAERQAGQARRERQMSNQEETRERQRSERGAAGSTRGRDMLIGNLSSTLKSKLGG